MIKTFSEIKSEYNQIAQDIADGIYNLPQSEYTFAGPLYTRIAAPAKAFGTSGKDEYVVAKCKLKRIYSKGYGEPACVDYTLTYGDVTNEVTNVMLEDLDGELFKMVVKLLVG